MRVDVTPVAGQPTHVRLRFTNDADTTQWLAAPRALPEGRLKYNLFEFEPAADYLGIIIKRTPYQPDELLRVEPGEVVHSDEIDLAELYRLPEDRSPVKVRYSKGHPLQGPEHGGGPFETVQSEWVTLSLED